MKLHANRNYRQSVYFEDTVNYGKNSKTSNTRITLTQGALYSASLNPQPRFLGKTRMGRKTNMA